MPSARPTRTLSALVTLGAFTLGSCAGDTSSTETTGSVAATTTTAATTTVAPTTTVDPATLAAAYADPGPHPVGVTTLQLTDGPQVEVWYPAVDGTTGVASYDVRDFLPDAIRALLTVDIVAGTEYPGSRDVAVADGRFPVVLFSHGFTGIRMQSTFLTSHLASWGMIVVAPDHPSRDLRNVLGGTASGDRNEAVVDLLASLDLLIAAGADPTSLFNDHVDDAAVIAVGHSAGGGTVLAAAADPRIDGYVSLASGVLRAGDTSTSVAPTDLPDRPSFFMAGTVDEVVPAETVTRPAFEAAPSPSLLWVITGVGHNGFDDFCTFGNGTGIIGIAEAAGLGALLDTQPALRRLGEDGCVPPALAATDTFPMIRHAVTAWIRHALGVDEQRIGIGPDVADAFVTPVEIVEK